MSAQVTRVTVLDTVTIITAAETIYRYDLPAQGLIDGWARPGLIAQLKESAGEEWLNTPVLFDAPPTLYDTLADTLRARGFQVFSSEDELPHDCSEDNAGDDVSPAEYASASEENAGSHDYCCADDADDEDPTITRRDFSFSHESKPKRSFPWYYAVIPLLVVFAVCVYFFFRSGQHGDEEVTTAEISTDASSLQTREEAARGAPTSPENRVSPASSEKILPHNDSAQQSRVDPLFDDLLPKDYHSVPAHKSAQSGEDPMYTAVSKDPEQRIYLSVESVEQKNMHDIHDSMLTAIVQDPTLKEMSAGAPLLDDELPVVYEENPGDGSMVLWHSWFVHDKHVMVGCHTRQRAHASQSEECTRVVEHVHQSVA